jgi:hypothetical protein
MIVVLSTALTACAAPEPVPPPPLEPLEPVSPASALPGLRAVPSKAIRLAQTPKPPSFINSDWSFGRSKASRTLILQSSDLDPKAYANLEEDLNVMYRILSKARGQDDESSFHSRLEDITLKASGSVGVKSLYIEGYGAVFMLGVRFPLVAPQAAQEAPKPKDTTSDEWNRAKDELYSRNTFELNIDRIVGKMSSPPEPYEARKVEDLTVSILESLKNGTHIRNLKGDEFVTVVVFGPDNLIKRTPVVEKEEHEEDGKVKRKVHYEDVMTGRGETTMTIRAKKSDIDDFAKGKLNEDTFRKRAKIVAYLRPSDTPGKATVVSPARQ